MKLFLMLNLVIANAFAAFPIIDVQDLEGSYLNEKGTAHAMKARYVLPNVEISHEDIDVNFNKEEKKLRISDPQTSVILDFDFSFMNIFKVFDFSGVEVQSTDKLFWLKALDLDIFIDKKEYNLDEVYVETDVRNIPTQDDEDITVVDGLILNAVIRAKRLGFRDFDGKFFDNLREENPSLVAEVNGLESKRLNWNLPVIVRHLNYVVKEGNFTGRALMDSYINLWLRIGGVMKTDKKNTVMTIELNRAKLGIFSVRRTLLRMVRNLKLEGISVDKNIITIKLDTVILGGRTGKP